MTVTQTPNYQLQKIQDATEDTTWGERQREDQDRLDDILGGYLSLSVAGSGAVTLSEAQYDHRYIEFTGTLTGNREVNFPAYERPWRVYNNTSGSYTLTVKVAGQTGVVVPQGAKYTIQGNGTDVFLHDEDILATPLDTNDNAINESEGSAVASAATTNIWATDGNTVHVTGTTTITSLGTAPRIGAIRRVIFDGALTLTHNASTLILPGGSNINTTAGDCAWFYADTTTGIRCIAYMVNQTPGGFDSGTAMLFQQTAAPTGWTKSTTHNDKSLRVVSGSASSGGADAFTSVFGASKSTASHTLTASESGLPSHNHSWTRAASGWTQGSASTSWPSVVVWWSTASDVTGNAGGTSASSGHSHNLTMNLQYVDVIIATKD